jgi:hypothetical protein
MAFVPLIYAAIKADPSTTCVNLRGLAAAEDSKVLLKRLAGAHDGMDESLVSQALHVCADNPFYLAAYARELAHPDRQMMVMTKAGYASVGPDLPPEGFVRNAIRAIRGVLMSFIDAVGPINSLVLKVASCLDNPFDVACLKVVYPHSALSGAVGQPPDRHRKRAAPPWRRI